MGTKDFKLEESTLEDIERLGLDPLGVKLLVESFYHNFTGVHSLYFDYMKVTFHMRAKQWASPGGPIHMGAHTPELLNALGINPFAAKIVAQSFIMRKSAKPVEIMSHGVVLGLARSRNFEESRNKIKREMSNRAKANT